MPYLRFGFLTVLSLSLVGANAQVPGWILFQGRVNVGQQVFQGWGHFKFSFVTGGPEASIIWHHDGSDVALERPNNALQLWVTNGLFEVALGDTSVGGMAPLPADLGRTGNLQVRVWFNDGEHGWERLMPDLRVGAVPYALHADGVRAESITLNHLAPELQARLGNTNGGTATFGEGALMLAPSVHASNLMQAGFAPFPLQFAQTMWQTEYLDARLTPAYLTARGTNVWDGSSLWLWRWGGNGQPGQGARYDAATRRWEILPTVGAPAFDASKSWIVPSGGDLMIVEAGDSGWRASRFNRASQAWETAAMPAGLPWPATVTVLDLPEGPVLLAGVESALAGAQYNLEEKAWNTIPTNGVPALEWAGAKWAELTNGWLVLGQSGGEVQLWRYQTSPPAWQQLAAAGFSLNWGSGLQTVWTGAEWYWLEAQGGMWRGTRYVVASNQWVDLPATNAPAAHAATQCLWTGKELILVNVAVASTGNTVYSARFDPLNNRWRAMTFAAPYSAFAPPPRWMALPEGLLMVRVSDPSRYARYDYAADRWQPLDGPNLGFEALVLRTGAEVLALPYQPLPEEPMYLHRFVPAQPVGWYYRSAR